ncbi:hypothetical protein C9374_006857 [Naegleria lovaniensis]|uniref:Amidase domain-containing protein n=1 Tax=Naegleria lovaniensis TaxID=51637 RepID=A0AA88H5Y3_NAELO|nr:uncharacterized protein C9374_006857 [Naegleria lovaniensis]KAG2393326.1 hypothetical protein C9374_006857 [Naegleria lovaniensis]
MKAKLSRSDSFLKVSNSLWTLTVYSARLFSKQFKTFHCFDQLHHDQHGLENRVKAKEFPRHDPGMDLEAPISTNQQICFYSIEQSRKALASGKTLSGAKLTPTSMATHHLKRLNTLQGYYHTHIRIPSMKEMEQQLMELPKDLSGIFYHNIDIQQTLSNYCLTENIKELTACLSNTICVLETILRMNGGINLGQTTVPPFGMIRNPFNPSNSLSSGGAAAIAAGVGNVAIACDAAGSIAVPTGFSGNVGVKPSSDTRLFEGTKCGHNGVSIGTITRSIDDAALVWESLIPQDGDDGLNTEYTLSRWAKFCKKHGCREFEEKRICFISNFPWCCDLDSCIQHSFDDLVNTVKTDFFNVTYLSKHDFNFDDQDTIMEILKLCNVKLNDERVKQVELHSSSVAITYEDTRKVQSKTGMGIEGLFQTYDFLVIPVSTCVAWKVDHEKPISTSTDLCFNLAQYFNLVDCPVITLPLGEDHDFVPYGVQIVGKPRSGTKGLYDLFGFSSVLSPYTKYNPPEISVTSLKYCAHEDEYGFPCNING